MLLASLGTLAAAAGLATGCSAAGATPVRRPGRSVPAAGRVTRAPSRSAEPVQLPQATTPSWCSSHGSSFVEWSGTFPDLPLCGPGPVYGGTWSYVVQPGPSGAVAGYYNATPGFQCVELADRWLAEADGLAPVMAEGSQVAMNYHAAYPSVTTLVLNGSRAAVGHAPSPGDVISFSQVPDFQDPTDGHVAVVVSTRVDPRTGDGVVEIAQENVAEAAMRRDLLLEGWRLVDPSEPPNAEWQYPYAEWLHVSVRPVPVLRARALAMLRAGRAEARAVRARGLSALRAASGAAAPVAAPAAHAILAVRVRSVGPARAVTARVPRRHRQLPLTAAALAGAVLFGRAGGRSRRGRRRQRDRARRTATA